MTRVQDQASLHEKTVQAIARGSLPRAQQRHIIKEKQVAQRVNIQLVDDLDGTDADETVTFALDGIAYEIDLSKQNAKNFRYGMEQYVHAARKVSGKKKVKSTGNSKAVREWARGQGMEVSARGVVPAEIVAAYEAAH